MKKTLAIMFLFILLFSIPLSGYATLDVSRIGLRMDIFDELRNAINGNSGVSLTIPNGSWGTWKTVSTKRMSFRFEVKNTNTTKKVKSYDVTYYTCDEFKRQNGPTECVTLYQDIRAYETITTPEIFLSNSRASNMYYVYAAITRVRYSDGSTEYESNPSYTVWTLRDY